MSKYIGPDNDPNDLRTIIVDLSERVRSLEVGRRSSVTTSANNLQIPFFDSSNYNPPSNTTSASFVTLQTSTFVKQRNYLNMTIYFYCSDGTTNGEFVITDGSGNSIYGVNLIPLTQTVTVDILTTGLTTGSVSTLNIMVRRTVGTGTIGCRVLGAYEHD